MLLANYSILNANPGRQLGGITAPNYWLRASRLLLTNAPENYIPNQTEKQSLYNGYLTPYNIGLPMKAGNLKTIFLLDSNGRVAYSNLAGGLNATSNIAGSGTLTSLGGLIVSLVASLTSSGLFLSDIIGKLEAVSELAGDGNITGSLGALADVVITLNGSGSFSGGIKAKGNIGADITPFSELSPQSLASSIWNTIATEYNTSGTMGQKLNSAAVGGVDYEALAQAVWEYIDRTLTEGGGGPVTVDYDLIADTVWQAKSKNAKNVTL